MEPVETNRHTPTARILNTAADLIEERGWGKGAAAWGIGHASEICIEGAIYAAMGQSLWDDAEYALGSRKLPQCRAYKAVKEYLDWVGPLYRWNDHEARDAEHVVAVLRAAAFVTAAREEAEWRGRAVYNS